MEQRKSWTFWLPLLVVVVWIAVAAWASVALVAWGLAFFAAFAAVARAFFPALSPLVVRRQFLDVAILAAFAVAFAYLALTARLG
jgi:hypothetical protein